MGGHLQKRNVGFYLGAVQIECVPRQIHMLKPYPAPKCDVFGGEGFGRYLGLEGGALMTGMGALVRRHTGEMISV